MNTLRAILAFACASTCAFAQPAGGTSGTKDFEAKGSFSKPFIVGTIAPSTTLCNAATEPGAVYLRTGNPATVPTAAYHCVQTGASTYDWQQIGVSAGTSVPTTCVGGGPLFFKTDAAAGQKLYGCNAALGSTGTFTALFLVVGTDVQAFDSDLTTWSGITPAAGIGTFLGTPSSANLRTAMTDETGTGAAVFATDPTIAMSGGRLIPPNATFASPPSSPVTGQEFTFTDASAAGVCTGGGTSLAKCRWSGSAYVAVGGGGGGGSFTVASQAEAEAGTENTKGITSLRAFQAIQSRSEFIPILSSGIVTVGANCSVLWPCRFGWDNAVSPVTAPVTFAWLSGTSGTTYIWKDSGGCKYGNLTGWAVTVSGSCTSVGTITDYPTTTHLKIGRIFGSGSAIASVTDDRAFMRAWTRWTLGTGLQPSGETANVANLTVNEMAALSLQGNGLKFATAGTVTNSRCAEWDANGKLVSAAAACGSGSSPTTTDNWYSPIGWPQTSTTNVSGSSTANVARVLLRPMPHTQLAYQGWIEIATLSTTAGATCHLVIWDVGGTKLTQSAAIPAGSADSIGIKTPLFSPSVTLTASQSYWHGTVCSHTDVLVRGVSGSLNWGTVPTHTGHTYMGTGGTLSGGTVGNLTLPITGVNNMSVPVTAIFNN
jgi:hypothetical protein